jgi:hypothetical protein
LKYKVLFAAAIIAVFFAGCATLRTSKEIVEFSISPDKGIKPGAYVVVLVRTTDIVNKVYGYLDVMGSPKILLNYDAKKKAWVKVIPIPVTFQIPKGEFTAKVEAIGKNGEVFVSEKKVSTY